MKKVVNLTLHEENTSVSFRRQRNSNSAEKKELKVTIYQSRNPTVERDYVGGGEGGKGVGEESYHRKC
jgi:hypothetical protein